MTLRTTSSTAPTTRSATRRPRLGGGFVASPYGGGGGEVLGRQGSEYASRPLGGLERRRLPESSSNPCSRSRRSAASEDIDSTLRVGLSCGSPGRRFFADIDGCLNLHDNRGRTGGECTDETSPCGRHRAVTFDGTFGGTVGVTVGPANGQGVVTSKTLIEYGGSFAFTFEPSIFASPDVIPTCAPV